MLPGDSFYLALLFMISSNVFRMSAPIQSARGAISTGNGQGSGLMQAYTASGFSRVKRQKGYLMMAGVFPPTPSSR